MQRVREGNAPDHGFLLVYKEPALHYSVAVIWPLAPFVLAWIMLDTMWLSVVFVFRDFKIWNVDNPKWTPEIIICAAMRTAEGIVIPCMRHCDGYSTMLRKRLRNTPCAEEGFLTSGNRFVNREEAYFIHRETVGKSADPNGYGKLQTLYSEDLY